MKNLLIFTLLAGLWALALANIMERTKIEEQLLLNIERQIDTMKTQLEIIETVTEIINKMEGF